MTNFPAQRVALQPFAQLFVDEALLIPATDVQIDQVPVPSGIIKPVLGLWPVFTSGSDVLYYQTPGGVQAFEPIADGGDLDPVSVDGAWDTGEAGQNLIAALNTQGIPLTDETTNTLDLTTSQSVTGSLATGEATESLIQALIAIGLPLVDNTTT